MTYPSLLSGQNFYLRLLVLLITLVGSLDASLRQILAQIVLFLVFFLLDLPAYSRLLSALRRMLPLFAGYWVFATLFGTAFPQMLLFSLKLITLLLASVYAFSNLSFALLLKDTRGLRRCRWGRKAVHYLMATTLFIRYYAKYFKDNNLKANNSVGSLIDALIAAGHQVFGRSRTVEYIIRRSLSSAAPSSHSAVTANLITLSLITLIVLINSL